MRSYVTYFVIAQTIITRAVIIRTLETKNSYNKLAICRFSQVGELLGSFYDTNLPSS